MLKNKIGVIYPLSDVLTKGVDELLTLDIECVQLQCFTPELFTYENAEKVKATLDGKLRISSLWAGWSGPQEWNFKDGPQTLGLVPTQYRLMRLNELKAGADFAEWLGVCDMATHVGFIPENPSTDEFKSLLETIKEIAEYCSSKGIHFNFETGQETPTTLMRMITDGDNPLIGINLGPANLIMYGKGNPVDALDLFKGRVRGVHIKDGNYPCDSFYELGCERVVGEGSVNYPVFLPKLINNGYTGDLYIEREISGEQQFKDIASTIKYIKTLV